MDPGLTIKIHIFDADEEQGKLSIAVETNKELSPEIIHRLLLATARSLEVDVDNEIR